MTRRVSNFSDLIQRVTANWFLHPLAVGRYNATGRDKENNSSPSETEKNRYEEEGEEESSDEDEEVFEDEENDEEFFQEEKMVGARVLKVKQMESIMEEVFETVSSLKRAYVSLQEAHSPWDPERMRVADMAVVAELRKLTMLRERFRQSSDGGRKQRKKRRGNRGGGGVSLREVVAPYEAMMDFNGANSLKT